MGILGRRVKRKMMSMVSLQYAFKWTLPHFNVSVSSRPSLYGRKILPQADQPMCNFALFRSKLAYRSTSQSVGPHVATNSRTGAEIRTSGAGVASARNQWMSGIASSTAYVAAPLVDGSPGQIPNGGEISVSVSAYTIGCAVPGTQERGRRQSRYQP